MLLGIVPEVLGCRSFFVFRLHHLILLKCIAQTLHDDSRRLRRFGKRFEKDHVIS